MSIVDGVNDRQEIVKDHAQQAAQSAQVQARELAGHAKDATQDVAATAADRAGNVKDETVRQTRNLVHEATDQVSAQASEQSQRLSALLRDLGDELKQMASAGSGGTATELAHHASERAHHAAGYLDGRQPSELLEDLRSYARRRPGAFLTGAALLGLATGRLGRGMKHSDKGDGAANATGYGVASTEPGDLSYPVPASQEIDLSAGENMGLSSNRGSAYVDEALAVPAEEPLYAEQSLGGQP